MSHARPSVPPAPVGESLPVSGVTTVLLLLTPCLLLLLLLHCILLAYKLCYLGRRRWKRRRTSVPVPSPAPQLLTCCSEHRLRVTHPGGSLKAPSTIISTGSTSGSTARAELPNGAHLYGRYAALMTRSSSSETDHVNPVPPNSPELSTRPQASSCSLRPVRRSSTIEHPDEMTSLGVPTVDTRFECEYISSIPPEASRFVVSANSSAVGPGLDSDFGASAGVSLRILSCDSDGFSIPVLGSGLEWDYYDPCYVSQNHIPKHMYHMPTVTTKQYWV